MKLSRQQYEGERRNQSDRQPVGLRRELDQATPRPPDRHERHLSGRVGQ